MIRSLAELAGNPDLMRPPQLLVPPCGVAGRTALVVLGPKGGKSTTLAAMIASASRDGFVCLLVAADEALADTVQRLIRFGAAPDRVHIADTFDPEEIVATVEEFGVRFIGVDHLGKLAELHPDFGPGAAGDAILWGRLVAPFTELARKYDLAAVLLDQARRSDGKYAGSAAKAGTVDFVVELESKDGGLVASPRGRTYLAPFRIDLDGQGVPVFSTQDGNAPGSDGPVPSDVGSKAAQLLGLLADAEPEGLSSARWLKLAEIPQTSFHRVRRTLLTQGLALGPDSTRSKRYRVTDAGERWLTTCHGTTTAPPMAVPASAKPIGGVGSGTKSRHVPGSGTPAMAPATALPWHHEDTEAQEERLGIESEVAP